MELIIAEKKGLAEGIKDSLFPKAVRRGNTFEYGNTVIAWVSGHILKLKAPSTYDSRYEKWSLGHLPIRFPNWEHEVDPEKEKLASELSVLIKKADKIIHAGDPDDEGQYLIDEVLDFYKYKGPVMRLSTNDLNADVVRKAYAGMVDNETMRSIGRAAYARSVADFVVGINYSRYFSLNSGERLYVGRVQTPTLGLVVARDALIEGHDKISFFNTIAIVDVNGTKAAMKLIYPKDNPSLVEGRVLDKAVADKMAAALQGKAVDVTVTKRVHNEAAPLPFNLVSLQTAAFRRFGYSPAMVGDIAQALRTSHKLITYNRSECRYLNDEQFLEAPQVGGAALSNLGTTATALGLDFTRKSKAFSTASVGQSAHTGIIPTATKANMGKLTEQEKNVYKLIAAQYLAQFAPPAKKETTALTAPLSNGFSLKASGTTVLDKGYLLLIPTKNSEADGDEGVCVIPSGKYPKSPVTDSFVVESETKPPSRYNVSSLNEDMTCIAKYVTDPEIKAMLLAKDEGEAGENGSIGTAATRTSTIERLAALGYIEIKGKNMQITSTTLGREFYALLPDEVRKPDLTAKWWAICEQIKSGASDVETLLESVDEGIERLLRTPYTGRVTASAKAGGAVIASCPKCGSDMLKGKMGWYCVAYKSQPACKFTLSFAQYGKTLTEKQAAKLLQTGRVEVKGFTSKKSGKKYDATLVLGEPNERGFVECSLSFPPRGSKAS